jgi:hypothetical protein
LIEVVFCVPDDQQLLLPRRRRAPRTVQPGVPIPRRGDLVYLSSTSAWAVSAVVHEWRSTVDLRIEVWLEHVGGARQHRPPGFETTQ